MLVLNPLLLFSVAYLSIERRVNVKLLCSVPGEWNKDKKKKRRSRWAESEAEKTFIPGMPTVIPPGLTSDQEEQYLGRHLVLALLRSRRSNT